MVIRQQRLYERTRALFATSPAMNLASHISPYQGRLSWRPLSCFGQFKFTRSHILGFQALLCTTSCTKYMRYPTLGDPPQKTAFSLRGVGLVED
jgi:hypothetical protein